MRGLSRPLRASAQTAARCIASSSSPLPPTASVTRPRRRKLSALAQQTATATSSSPSSQPAWNKPTLPPPQRPAFKQETHQRIRPDPYVLAASELQQLRSNLLNLLGSAHPGLTEIAQYYFLNPSKQLRSLLVLLFARATNGIGQEWERKHWEAGMEAHGGRGDALDKPLYSSETLSEWNPSMPDHTESFAAPFELRRDVAPSPSSSFVPPLDMPIPALMNPATLLPTQMRLAQIVEMIHIAFLLHENIDNTTSSEESSPSPSASENPFGIKLSILGGDFLLGRASTALSRLGESEVVELVASIISNLVEGEFLRMDKVQTPSLGAMKGPQTLEEAWDMYLRKTYLQSASLMAKGARASVVLGGCKQGDIWQEVAYVYGRNLGIAHQLVKDSLELESAIASSSSSGLKPGLASAPAIYAWEESPEIRPLVQRNFTKEGDLDLAVDCVRRTSGIERTRVLAYTYTERAREVLKLLPDSDAKMALEALTEQVTQRNWS